MYNLTIIIVGSEAEEYAAYYQEYPGCIAEGATQHEALSNLNRLSDAFFRALTIIGGANKTSNSGDTTVLTMEPKQPAAPGGGEK